MKASVPKNPRLICTSVLIEDRLVTDRHKHRTTASIANNWYLRLRVIDFSGTQRKAIAYLPAENFLSTLVTLNDVACPAAVRTNASLVISRRLRLPQVSVETAERIELVYGTAASLDLSCAV